MTPVSPAWGSCEQDSLPGPGQHQDICVSQLRGGVGLGMLLSPHRALGAPVDSDRVPHPQGCGGIMCASCTCTRHSRLRAQAGWGVSSHGRQAWCSDGHTQGHVCRAEPWLLGSGGGGYVDVILTQWQLLTWARGRHVGRTSKGCASAGLTPRASWGARGAVLSCGGQAPPSLPQTPSQEALEHL